MIKLKTRCRCQDVVNFLPIKGFEVKISMSKRQMNIHKKTQDKHLVKICRIFSNMSAGGLELDLYFCCISQMTNLLVAAHWDNIVEVTVANCLRHGR